MADDAQDEIRLRFEVLGRATVLEVKRFGEEVGYVTINIFGPHAKISQTMTVVEAQKLHEALEKLFEREAKATPKHPFA